MSNTSTSQTHPVCTTCPYFKGIKPTTNELLQAYYDCVEKSHNYLGAQTSLAQMLVELEKIKSFCDTVYDRYDNCGQTVTVEYVKQLTLHISRHILLLVLPLIRLRNRPGFTDRLELPIVYCTANEDCDIAFQSVKNLPIHFKIDETFGDLMLELSKKTVYECQVKMESIAWDILDHSSD